MDYSVTTTRTQGVHSAFLLLSPDMRSSAGPATPQPQLRTHRHLQPAGP